MLKSTLPGKIQPSKNQEEVRNWLKVRQENQSYYYNRHTKELPKLHRVQAIYPVRKTWNLARVVKEGDSPRSYIVETGTGAHLRRNRIHLRPNNAPQGRMMSQSSGINSQELMPADNSANNLSNNDQITRPSSANPQCSTLAETENNPRKSRSGRVIRAPERLLDLLVVMGMIYDYYLGNRTYSNFYTLSSFIL